MNSTIKPSACKTCGSPYHSAMYHKPRKPMEPSVCTNCGREGHSKTFCGLKPDKIKLQEAGLLSYHCTHCDSLEHNKSKCPEKRPDWKDRVPGPDGRYPPLKSYIIGFKEKWGRCRKQWMKNTPPNHAGFYQCHYCGLNIPKDEMQLDHKIPRSRAPELRFELSNLTPSCGSCNFTKGSIDHDNFNHDCPDNVKETQ